MSSPILTGSEASNLENASKHVLVVDDEADIAESYREMLQANHYKVTIASNGVEALKTIMQTDVDAIFCDMMMPTMAGDMFYLAVEKVKPHLCHRFIFVTGYQGNPKFEAFFKKFPGVVLYKPLTLGKLTGTLKLLFSKLAATETKKS